MAKKYFLEIITVLIAVFAMLGTYLQADIARAHNKRSVIPYLGFEQSGPPELKTISISIKNEGLGPAVVNGIDFTIEGNTTSQRNGLNWNKIKPIIEKKFKVDLNEKGILFSSAQGKLIIPSGKKIELIAIHPAKISKETIILMEKIFDYIKPAVCYRSIYADPYFLRSSEEYLKEESCNTDGAINIFGNFIKLKAPWTDVLSHSDVFGL